MEKRHAESLQQKRSFFVRMVWSLILLYILKSGFSSSWSPKVSDPKLYNPKIVKLERRHRLLSMDTSEPARRSKLRIPRSRIKNMMKNLLWWISPHTLQGALNLIWFTTQLLKLRKFTFRKACKEQDWCYLAFLFIVLKNIQIFSDTDTHVTQFIIVFSLFALIRHM